MAKIFYILSLLLFAAGVSSAQSTNLLKDKNEQIISGKEGYMGFSTVANDGKSQIFFNGDSNLSVWSADTFIGSFIFVAEQNYKNGNTRTDTVSYYFGKKKSAIIIHAKRNQPDMRMVFNPTDSTITALFKMNEKNSGYVLPMTEKQWPGMRHALQPSKSVSPTKLDYSGDTKNIEGFTCRKVLAESSDYHAELWLTEDIHLTMLQVLGYQTIGAGKSQNELEQFEQFGVEGLPLEMFLTSKKDKADVNIYLKNFHETVNDSIFSIEGHSVSDLR